MWRHAAHSALRLTMVGHVMWPVFKQYPSTFFIFEKRGVTNGQAVTVTLFHIHCSFHRVTADPHCVGLAAGFAVENCGRGPHWNNPSTPFLKSLSTEHLISLIHSTYNMCGWNNFISLTLWHPVVTTICTAQWSLYVPHSGHYMYHTVVTICTTRFNFHRFSVLPTQFIYVFCVDLRTNSDYFPIQH